MERHPEHEPAHEALYCAHFNNSVQLVTRDTTDQVAQAFDQFKRALTLKPYDPAARLLRDFAIA